ncbi:hypothetical protein M569_17696 [Genlisea aurea]|uniref:Uncharacterized protein n=1 Tax=Genlisea aurea TaxID=192259 RepID=S8BY74_9LAMI|nr:hypothetical protein M569_17696 [Genlisea aurea]
MLSAIQLAKGKERAVPAPALPPAGVVAATGVDTDERRQRRNYSVDFKMEVIKFFKYDKHTVNQTLARFPELKDRREEATGVGYARRWEAEVGPLVWQFFMGIREARGAVNRMLLEAYARSLPVEVTKGFNNVGVQLELNTLQIRLLKTQFFFGWVKAGAKIASFTGGDVTTMLLTGEFQEKVQTFNALLYSLVSQRNVRRIIVGDETAVRFEDLPGTTLELRGAQQVALRTGGKHRDTFTVWLSSEMVCNKYKPFLIFKGAPKGKVEIRLLLL